MVDRDLIRELTKLLDETGLTEIEIEQDGKRVRVARSAAACRCAARVPATLAPQPLGESADRAARSRQASGRRHLADGRHRLFSPEPGAEPFVEIGSR